MAGRTPREAVDNFLEPLKEVVGCVTDEGFLARIRRPGGPYPAYFQSGFAIVDRKAGLSPLRLALTQHYHVGPADGQPGLWTVRTSGWIYDVADSRDTLIAAFHWHPEDSGRVTRPHIHVHGQHDTVELHKLHFPTGNVSLDVLVRFLIEDLDVQPRTPDWERILERHEQPR